MGERAFATQEDAATANNGTRHTSATTQARHTFAWHGHLWRIPVHVHCRSHVTVNSHARDTSRGLYAPGHAHGLASTPPPDPAPLLELFSEFS